MKAKQGEAWAKVLEIATMRGVEECIEWPFYLNKAGYGQCPNPNKGSVMVNRIVCEIAHGPPPTPKHEAAHLCNNPPCCNPDHLQWKTSKENHADKVENGTTNRGARCGNAELSDDSVEKIRIEYDAGQIALHELATRYGVSTAAIWKVVHGTSWVDTPGPIVSRSRKSRAAKGSQIASSKSDVAQVEEIRYAYEAGVSQSKLAKMYGLSKVTISRMVRGEIWKSAGGPIIKAPKSSRKAMGEQIGNARLSMEKAREIRRLFNEGGISKAELGRRYGVDATTIKAVIQGKTWKED